jgi:F-type H+-transporting ATPase subunit delta
MAAVAKVYARALFELGGEKGQLDAILKDLSAFLEAAETAPALTMVLSGSGVDPNSRRAVLDAVLEAMGIKGVVAKLLSLLTSRGRVEELPLIVGELETLVERSQGIQAGRVRTAVELSADELSFLAAALSKRVGGKVRLSQSVDPALLGGVVATVSGKTFDASLRSQLDRFKNELI